jgi:hypothetical protein
LPIRALWHTARALWHTARVLWHTDFDSIKAPHKEYHLVPGTGHESSAASLEVLHTVLLACR